MKIRFDIQEQYREPEVHICCREKSEQTLALKASLERLLLTRLTVYKNQQACAIGIGEIVRIYSENKRVYVRTEAETFEIRDRLYNLEELLRDRGYVRISNSELVNVSRIDKLDMSYIGTIKVYLGNGDETFVSRRYVSRIKDVLG